MVEGERTRPALTAATAAMNVSAVRSSATTVLPHRGSKYPYTCGNAWR
jgi:hypothetical protein